MQGAWDGDRRRVRWRGRAGAGGTRVRYGGTREVVRGSGPSPRTPSRSDAHCPSPIGDCHGTSGRGRQEARTVRDHRVVAQPRPPESVDRPNPLTDSGATPAATGPRTGGCEADVIALSMVRSGEDVSLDAGILFALFASLRTPSRQSRRSRLAQVVAWLAGGLDEASRHAFAGGVAGTEILARDLKALGLYQARALSSRGVEVDILEHALTPEQRRISDAYAGAFHMIHAHLDAALEDTGVTDGGKTLMNPNAKSAALSAFEGTKQHFFGHLLVDIECPALPRPVRRRALRGHRPRSRRGAALALRRPRRRPARAPRSARGSAPRPGPPRGPRPMDGRAAAP